MLVLQVPFDALGAELAAVEGEVLPGFEPDDLVLLDLELNAALLAAEATVGLDDPIGLPGGLPSSRGHNIHVRSELCNQVRQRKGRPGHQPFTSAALCPPASRQIASCVTAHCIVEYTVHHTSHT